ncbi:MAG: hypothetical protein ACREOV_04605 [Candidatus Dormibacteraceae bacterium]
MTESDYGVCEFVADARALREGPDPVTDRETVVDRLRPLLARALHGPGWTDQVFRTEVDGRPGYRYYQNQDGSLQIYGVLFRQSRPTPVHDHVTWGLIGVHSGEQRTTRYWRRDDGATPGTCHVELRSDEVLTNGAVYELLPPHDIHRIEVLSPGEGLSIHVLGADLKLQRRRIFTPENDTCEEVEGVSMAR